MKPAELERAATFGGSNLSGLDPFQKVTEPSFRKMGPRECARSFVDDGLANVDLMVSSIASSSVKLAPKAVAPRLRF